MKNCGRRFAARVCDFYINAIMAIFRSLAAAESTPEQELGLNKGREFYSLHDKSSLNAMNISCKNR
jgi:hypothetical protein